MEGKITGNKNLHLQDIGLGFDLTDQTATGDARVGWWSDLDWKSNRL